MAKKTGERKPPVPSPVKTATVWLSRLAVTRSSAPSSSKSAKAMACGALCMVGEAIPQRERAGAVSEVQGDVRAAQVSDGQVTNSVAIEVDQDGGARAIAGG